MPLLESEERNVKHRINHMFMDTLQTFELISENSERYFGENSGQLREAINEYIRDFIENADGGEFVHPEALIFQTSRLDLQQAGFYGAQLQLKERQVREANVNLREVITGGISSAFYSPFKKWVARINNFLGSLGVTGVGEALKEIKDCLRDDLPDD